MNAAKKILLVVIAFFQVAILCAQIPEWYGGRKLEKSQLIEDYNILYNSIVNYHPIPFQYTSEEEIKSYVESQISNLPDALSELEFQNKIRQLIARFKCGHTFAKPSKEWYSTKTHNSTLLPFDVKLVNGKLLINNTVEGKFDFEINDEVLSINGISAEEILIEMSSIQERDGLTKSFVDAKVIYNFRTYYLFLYGVPDSFDLLLKKKTGEILKTKTYPNNNKLSKISKPVLPSNFTTVMHNDWSIFSFDSINHLGCLQITSFGDRKKFKKYYKAVFQYLQKDPTAQLIIDLRNNGGGYFGNANKLLTYLTPEKFEYNFQRPKQKITKNDYAKLDFWSKLTKFAFSIKPSKHKKPEMWTRTFTYKPQKKIFKGKIHVINNGFTFSQASLFASQLNEYRATFFGTETGGTENGTNAMLRYKLVLPNSKVIAFIPFYQIISNSSKGEFGYGINPDFYIDSTVDSSADSTLIEVVEKILEIGNKLDTTKDMK